MSVKFTPRINPKISNSDSEIAKYTMRAIAFNNGGGFELTLIINKDSSEDKEAIYLSDFKAWLDENSSEAYRITSKTWLNEASPVTILFQSETDAMFCKLYWS